MLLEYESITGGERVGAYGTLSVESISSQPSDDLPHPTQNGARGAPEEGQRDYIQEGVSDGKGQAPGVPAGVLGADRGARRGVLHYQGR